MPDNQVNNRKIILQPTNKPKIDIGEGNIFSSKVEPSLWETAVKQIMPQKVKEDSLQYQIFKVERETQKYEEALAKPSPYKIDFNC